MPAKAGTQGWPARRFAALGPRFPQGRRKKSSWERSVWFMPLKLILGAFDIPEPFERIRAQREPEARPVGRIHHAFPTDVERLVEELPHHRHPALADLEDVAIG